MQVTTAVKAPVAAGIAAVAVASVVVVAGAAVKALAVVFAATRFPAYTPVVQLKITHKSSCRPV